MYYSNSNFSITEAQRVQEKSITPDYTEAEKFLDLIAGEPGEPFMFRVVAERADLQAELAPLQKKESEKAKLENRKPKDLSAAAKPGTLAELWDWLVERNAQGWAVFVVINETTGNSDKDVVRIRANFADFDEILRDEEQRKERMKRLRRFNELAPASMAVSSSPDKFHSYWFTQGTPLENFKPFQKRIAEFFGSDPVISNLSRIMRVPGFLHQKKEPALTRITWTGSPEPIEASCLETALGQCLKELGPWPYAPTKANPGAKIIPLHAKLGEPPEGPKNREATASGEFSSDTLDALTARELLPIVADMLRFISSDIPRNEWWALFAAIADIGGADEALGLEAKALCREWSSGFTTNGGEKSTRYAGSTLYEEADFDKQWADCTSREYAGARTTWKGIRLKAFENGWTSPPEAFPVFARIAEQSKNHRDLVDVLNERYTWLNDEQEIFDLKYLTTRKKEQVKDDTAHLATKTGEKKVSGYDLWRCSPRKRRVAGRKFLPGQGQFVDADVKGRPLGGTYINLWQGWGCEPEKGDVAPLEKLIRHLCAGNEEEIRYLKWRIAIKIQKPWLKIPSYVLVVTKEEGTGKSQLGKFLGGLYGKHGRIITDRELESSFDDWKADGVIFAVSEEVSLRDKKSAANRLKAMASMEVQQINPKGKPSYETENFLDLYFTANECDAMYVRTEKERRPFIVKHDGVMPMSAPDAKALQHWYDHGGQAAMLHHFLYEVDGAAFDAHAAAPVTEGKRTMAKVCQAPAEKFVDELLTDAAEDAAEADGAPLRDFKNLLSDFTGESSNKRDERLLSMALEKAEIPHRRPRVGANRITLYAVTNRGEWKTASNEAWRAQYELQTAETRGECASRKARILHFDAAFM